MCQKEDSDRRCLSTGECRRCKYVAGTGLYEGCEITSGTPICDVDKTTDIVEYAVADYLTGTMPNPGFYADTTGYLDHPLVPDCAKCKMKGRCILLCAHLVL